MEFITLLQVAFASLLDGKLPPVDIIKLLISKVISHPVSSCIISSTERQWCRFLGMVFCLAPVLSSCHRYLISSRFTHYTWIVLNAMLIHVQVLNVVRNKSAEGLNALSFELETVGFLVGLSYGYVLGLPFSTYGEVVFLFAQNVLLLFLIYKYRKMSIARAFLLGSVLSIVVALVISGILPHRFSHNLLCDFGLWAVLASLRVSHVTTTCSQQLCIRSWHILISVVFALNLSEQQH
jgi:uncharacterized protein with PQ loop repeat